MKASVAELYDAQRDLQNMIQTIQNELDNAKKSVKDVQKADHLKGKVKEAINGNLGNHYLPLLDSYHDMLHELKADYQKELAEFQSTVEERNHAAVIDRNLLIQAEGQFSKALTEFHHLEKTAENVYSSVDDLVSFEHTSSTGFVNEMAASKLVLTHTKDWLDRYNGRKSGAKVEAIISNQRRQLNQMGKAAGGGYTSAKSMAFYQDDTFKKAIKKEHTAVLKAEKIEYRHEHPIITMIHDQYDKIDLEKVAAVVENSVELLTDGMLIADLAVMGSAVIEMVATAVAEPFTFGADTPLFAVEGGQFAAGLAAFTEEFGAKMATKEVFKGGERIVAEGTLKAETDVELKNERMVAEGEKASGTEKLIADRTKGLDLNPHSTQQKQLSAKKMKELKSKIDNRTIKKVEYDQYIWNKKFAKHRASGVDDFWYQERQRILNIETPTRNWNQEQINDILNGKKPKVDGKTVQGHHSYSASQYPHLANKGEVIYPATFDEHFYGWHGGNWKDSLPGRPINPFDDF
ncbi:T7SS effector LXG polymorphic toxin [Latilactobacillus fragifolii]|uniref:T7SS effector LXG polymorphic toxin n=1 Tax=Latilactobacillus fragifolii TaxID=2814244 RepID=UPI001EEB9DD6|nr:T7SS effector LXG polymorphic toxin [Latilactobacillus fragifolii]